MVPRPPLGAQPVIELPEAPPRIARHGVHQRRNYRGISATRRHRRLVVRRPRQPHHATGSLYWQPMLLYQHLSQLSLRGRPYNFRCRTSLMAACSSARSRVHPLELGVFSLELPQLSHIRHRRAPVLAPPLEEGRLADAVRP